MVQGDRDHGRDAGHQAAGGLSSSACNEGGPGFVDPAQGNAMTIKTLLVAASGGSASDGAIELACRLAAQFKAHVEAYHVMVDPVAIFAAS